MSDILIYYSKVSCIAYNSTAIESFKNLAPDRSMLNRIPLNLAFKLCKEFYQTNDKLVLYFMTDGEALMPHHAIKIFRDE